MLGKCHFIVFICIIQFYVIVIRHGKMEIHVMCLLSRMIFTMMCGLLFGSDGYYVSLAWVSCALMFFIVSVFYSNNFLSVKLPALQMSIEQIDSTLILPPFNLVCFSFKKKMTVLCFVCRFDP